MTRMIARQLAVAAALVLLCTSGFARAEAETAALEARVAELEALVRQLMDDRTVSPSEAVANREPQPIAETSSYRFGGYVKVDAMFSDYGDGDLEPGSLGSQFYVPSTIPVDGMTSEGPDVDMQGRETRINFQSDHSLANGGKFGTFLEMDFFTGSDGNERVSNSYSPRLRHAYVSYDNWLVGQTWSTFQDAGALAENLDFIGPAEGTTFVRQAQLRFTKGPWEFALENPETTITTFGGEDRIIADDGGIPDFVARYTTGLGNGYVKAAALVRQLDCETDIVNDTETAFGLSVSGKQMLGDDDVRWMATAGKGTGRYLGLNTSDDAVMDSNGNLNAIEQWGGFVSFRHFWDPEWRSNFTFSYLSNDNDTALTGTSVTKDVYSLHLNLLYEPIEKMTVGGEIIYAERTLENDHSGDMTRVLLSAKYAF